MSNNKTGLIKGYQTVELTQAERDERINAGAKKLGEYLEIIGFDWSNDPNMDNTPMRIAKSHVNELFAGCFTGEPKTTSFIDESNPTENYDGVVIQQGITINSMCSHHFLPFFGKAWVGYLTPEDGKVIGLSKLNRLAQYVARRPQNQERLTEQTVNILKKHMPQARGIIVAIEAKHTCTKCRGVGDDSEMLTIAHSGDFRNNIALRQEFLHLIKR